MGSRYLDVVQAVLDAPNNAGSPEFKTALIRLSSEIRDRLTKGSPSSLEFVCTAARAVSRIRGQAHAKVRMKCLLDAALYLFANGYDTEASEASNHLDMLARQVGDKAWMRKADTVSGIVRSHGGSVSDSILHFSKALELATSLGELEGEISVLVNLGNALNYGGLYREAIPCLLRAAALTSTSQAARVFEPHALCNLAQSYLHLDEFDKGFEAISKCIAKSDTPTDALSALGRTAREFTFVQLALEIGRLDLAREHSLACSAFALMAQSRRADFMASVCKGLCEIHSGDSTNGLATLERCLTGSGHVGPERAEALIALTKAYDLVEQPERALKCMSELLSTISTSRKASIAALLSASVPADTTVMIGNEAGDLAALRSREAHLRLRVAEREIVNSRIEMLERFAVTADLREEPSGEHGFRVGKLCALVAEDLGWSGESAQSLEFAARLHDVGKLAIPDRILLTRQELKEAERRFICAHAVIGAELLAKSNVPDLKLAEEIAHYHHEWWNGRGYPSQLAGRRIPVSARIVALADVFDALTHGRPYAEPWSFERALEEIVSRRSTQFDPELTDRFASLVRRLKIEHNDLDAFLGKAGQRSPFLQARSKIKRLIASELEIERAVALDPSRTPH
jgi:putative two-component system response regulator